MSRGSTSNGHRRLRFPAVIAKWARKAMLSVVDSLDRMRRALEEELAATTAGEMKAVANGRWSGTLPTGGIPGTGEAQTALIQSP